MKLFLVFATLMSLAKSGLLICLGIIVKDHLRSFLSMIFGNPIADNLIDQEKSEILNKLIRWIGMFIIVIGVGGVLTSLMGLLMGQRIPF